MMREYKSAGAVVVSEQGNSNCVLLLDQVRKTGERHTVAPKGRLEKGESPLIAARREVQEESGLEAPQYLAYLGQQRYQFIDNDQIPASKTVDWFLFVAAPQSATEVLATEGFVGASWHTFDDAVLAASHDGFREYIDRAAEIVAWRTSYGHRLDQNIAISEAVLSVTQSAVSVVPEKSGGIAICGSGARGDWVPGWSDLDFIAWGFSPSSQTGVSVKRIVEEAGKCFGIRASIHFAPTDSADAQTLSEMKVRASLARVGVDVPLLAGRQPVFPPFPNDKTILLEDITRLNALARQYQSLLPKDTATEHDNLRRTLAALSTACRLAVLSLDFTAQLRIPPVVVALQTCWPGNTASQILNEYDALRQERNLDLAALASLARRVPKALDELGGLVKANG